MNFSLITPTKNNLSGLKEFITSFIDKAKYKDQIEFLIAPDIGDPDLGEIQAFAKDYPVRVYETHPTENFARDYYNWLAFKSCGDNLWNLNDDVAMLTQDWDEIILNKVKGKEIYLVDVWDTTHEQGGHSFPRFSLISRKAIDTVGFFLFPQVRTHPGDKIIYLLYEWVDAIIECHEVKLRHDWLPNADPSKSKAMRLYNIDLKDGIFPINCYVPLYQLRKALDKEWNGQLR